MDLLHCKNCDQDLEPEKFYFRKDTNKYSTTCRPCRLKIDKMRKEKGLVKHRTTFNFTCIACKISKTSSDFYLKDKKTNRYDTVCKECRKSSAKQWHQDNREQSLKNKNEWHNRNRDDNIKRMKENYAKRMQDNPTKEYEDRRLWRLANKDKMKKHMRTRYATDVNFKLGQRLRGNAHRIIKNGCKKHCKTLELLDCSIEFVRSWLEYQFDENMNWENYGSYWVLDHFIPVASFDLTRLEEQMKCFHWSNLQPLEKTRNNSKNDKIPTCEEQEEFNKRIDLFLNITEK